MQRRAQQQGFTLIELMIVVTVIVVLLAIAVPSYSGYVGRARRATAQGCLLERAQFLERFYATNLSYSTDTNGVAVAMPSQPCVIELTGFYTFNFAAAPTASTYTLRAQPVAGSSQVDDECGTLTLTHAGVKGNSTGGTDCWR